MMKIICYFTFFFIVNVSFAQDIDEAICNMKQTYKPEKVIDSSKLEESIWKMKQHYKPVKVIDESSLEESIWKIKQNIDTVTPKKKKNQIINLKK